MRKYKNVYSHLPHNPNLRERARELRKAGNLCEVLMWKQSRNKNFKEYDKERDSYMEELGLKIIHIRAGDVLHRMSDVMEMLYNHPALWAPLRGGELRIE